MSNIYGLDAAMLMYADGNDGHFPPAATWVDSLNAEGWKLDAQALRCPRDRSGARCSYGMNAALSGARTSTFQDEVVTLYETAHPGDNPAGGPEDVASPPRHRDGNIYAFESYAVKPPMSRPPKFGP